jgi:hypothetical protein
MMSAADTDALGADWIPHGSVLTASLSMTAEPSASDNLPNDGFGAHTGAAIPSKTAASSMLVVRCKNIPVSWQEDDLQQCLEEVVEVYGRSFQISAFHTSATHSESKTALLVPNPLYTGELRIPNRDSNRTIEIIPAIYPDVHLHLDSSCTGLTTLYEPRPNDDLGAESVDTIVNFST